MSFSLGDSRDGVYVLSVVGALDVAAIDNFVAAADGAGPGQRLILDLSRVSFVDSSGLRALLQVGIARDHLQGMQIRNPPAALTELLELTGLTDHFDVGFE